MGDKNTPKTIGGDDSRLIMLWSRRYAQSRTISFLVQWICIVILVGGIGIAGTLTQRAYLQKDMTIFSVSIFFGVLSMLAFAWFSMSSKSGEAIWKITQWFYGEEGYVDYTGGRGGQLPVWITALGGGLVIYHILCAMLISFNYLSVHNLQPCSALYMSPFFALMIVYQRLGIWAWAWPVLYGIHGILLFTGAPVSFTGQWQILNLVVPIFGYGFIAIIAGHIYSRYALYRLKQLTKVDDIDFSEIFDENGDEAGEDK